ncbi:MAG: enoyl-CoA hydratase-related protein [Alphaproteobacteria bacterium]
MSDYLRIETKEHHSVWVVLARPDKHNAFDEHLIAGLTDALKRVEADGTAASIVLAAEGQSFSAGADLDWMRRAAAFTREENIKDARALGRLLHVLDNLSKPTVAVVQGAAYGGALGLIACCDIAIAAEEAKFSFSETRLGLIPAVISPYAVSAIGARNARRYFQSAEIFSAAAAKDIGLVHEVVPGDKLNVRVDEILAALALAAPHAKAAAKRLIKDVAHRPISDVMETTAQLIADTRTSPEAREGLQAFFDKRKPNWQW